MNLKEQPGLNLKTMENGNMFAKAIKAVQEMVRQHPLLLLILLVIGGGNAIAPHLGANTETINSPRGPQIPIILTDTNAQNELVCLKELFYKLADSPPGKNQWLEENCDKAKMTYLAAQTDPLTAIAGEKDEVLRKAGVPSGTLQIVHSSQGEGNGYKTVMTVNPRALDAAIAARRIKPSEQQEEDIGDEGCIETIKAFVVQKLTSN